MATKKHILNTESFNSDINETETVPKTDEFYFDLCRAMVSINVPWNSLSNETWRNFLQKYTQKNIPNESTIRKNYLNKVYTETIKKIREKIGDNFVWISVDETTDVTGRSIANFIIGKLSDVSGEESFLLCSKELEKTNFSTIARFVNASILTLWPSGLNADKVLLFITDAAPYMMKAAQHLKIFYPNMNHLTCVVHGIHRVAEKIRDTFPMVDKFISLLKKVFLKSPTRTSLYKEIMGNVPLPPYPILTRWGTWITTANFYSKHFEKIKQVSMQYKRFCFSICIFTMNILQVLESLDSEDAKCIKEAQILIKDQQLFIDLLFIQNHFSMLPEIITKLESKGMRLTESMELFFKLKHDIEAVPGDIGKIVSNKLNLVLSKNPAFNDFCGLASVFNKITETPDNISIEKQFWNKFVYAPVTSCDVERSFSAFKYVLQDKRESFKIENIEKVLIIYCNKNI